VNGTRVRRAALLPNDQLGIAHFKFRVFLGPDEPDEPPKPTDHTQALEPDEVARALRGKGERGRTDGVHRNQLPDVYDDK
jgi:hypothetical protein